MLYCVTAFSDCAVAAALSLIRRNKSSRRYGSSMLKSFRHGSPGVTYPALRFSAESLPDDREFGFAAPRAARPIWLLSVVDGRRARSTICRV